ncbi:hypothetical protein ElyMa_006052400 [Elysia marginata]|uniref:Uncharacterized protein n=1 Tax=Elysia marginata TaxID=1093978 RepID=A0AAV4GL35_9GAST|nr:hypothetical protein ElyMa_006052400 [Elysia marginata]
MEVTNQTVEFTSPANQTMTNSPTPMPESTIETVRIKRSTEDRNQSSGNETERTPPSLTQCSAPCPDSPNHECRMVTACKNCTAPIIRCIKKKYVDPVFERNRFREDFCAPFGVVLHVQQELRELLPVKCFENETCPNLSECKMSFTDGKDYCCAKPGTDPPAVRKRRTAAGQTRFNSTTSTATSATPTFPPYVTYENQTFSLIIDVFTTLFPFTTTSKPDAQQTVSSSSSSSSNPVSRRKRSYRDYKETRRNLKKGLKPSVKPDCLLVTMTSTKQEWNSKVLTPPVTKRLPHPKQSAISVARVVEQISKVKCTRSATFFFMGRILLVRGGCSAVFMVCFKPSPSGGKFPVYTTPEVVAALTTAAPTTPPTTTTVPAATTAKTLTTTKKPTTVLPARDAGPGFSVCRNVILRSSLYRSAALGIPSNSGSITSMSLVRQFSSRRCVNGVNFNFDGSVAIATRGCRGEFRICQRQDTRDPPVAALTTDTVVTTSSPSPVPLTTEDTSTGCHKLGLKSTKGTPVRKLVMRDNSGHIATITSVTLLEEFSHRKCRERDTYFYNESLLFVTGRCFGFFLVCFKTPTQKPSTPSPTPIHNSTTHATVPDTTTTRKPSCKIVSLTSTPKYPDVRVILDSMYRHVNITSVTLIIERSEHRCRPGKGYLVKESSIIARKGCAGDFAVCFEITPVESTTTPDASTGGSETTPGITNTTGASTAEPSTQEKSLTVTTTIVPDLTTNSSITESSTTQSENTNATVTSTVDTQTTQESTNSTVTPTVENQTTQESTNATLTPTVENQTTQESTNATVTPTVETQTTQESTNATVATSSSVTNATTPAGQTDSTPVTSTAENQTSGITNVTTPTVSQTTPITNVISQPATTTQTVPITNATQIMGNDTSAVTTPIVSDTTSTPTNVTQIDSATNTSTGSTPATQTNGINIATTTPAASQTSTTITLTLRPIDYFPTDAATTATVTNGSTTATPSQPAPTAPTTEPQITGNNSTASSSTFRNQLSGNNDSPTTFSTPQVGGYTNTTEVPTTERSNGTQNDGNATASVTPGSTSTIVPTTINSTSVTWTGPPSYLTCTVVGLASTATSPDVSIIKDTFGIPADIQYMELIMSSTSGGLCRKGETFLYMGAVVIAENGCAGAFEGFH